MNPRAKSTAALLVTLIIGFVLGALFMITVRRRHMERIEKIREQQGFMFFHERLIQPTEAQRDTLQKILQKYSPRFFDIARRHRKEISVLRDSLLIELETVLTPEQMQRLKERPLFKRFHPGRGGPPFRDRQPWRDSPRRPPGGPPERGP